MYKIIVPFIITMLIFFPSFGNSFYVSSSIIMEYFQSKRISSITILASCWESRLKRDAMKVLSKNGLTVSFSLGTIPEYPQRRLGAVFDLTCDSGITENIFNYITKGKYFGVHTEWLLIDKGEISGKLENTFGVALLGNSYVLPGSAVTLAQISLLRIQYFDVYRITMNGLLIANLLGEGPLNKLPTLSKRRERHDFRGEPLKSGIFVNHPEELDSLDNEKTPVIETWAKVHYAMVINLAQLLNFKFTLPIVTEVGRVQENGNFTGYIGYVAREEFDFSGTGLFIRHDRMNKLEYTSETFPFKAAIIFKQPSLSTISNIFLLPFATNVWLSYVALFLVTMIVLWVGKIISKSIRIRPYSPEISTPDIFTMVFGHICQQGSHLDAISLSARMTIFVFSFSTIFFFTSYTANIVTLLQLTSNSLKTIKDLISSPLKIKSEWWQITDILFNEAVDPDLQKLYQTEIRPYGKKAYCDVLEGMQLMKNEPVGYHVELNKAYKVMNELFTESEKCGISEIPLFFLPRFAFFFVKKSGYREIFTQKVLWQKEIGIIDRLSKIYFAQKPICESSGAYRPVGIIDTYPAVLVLIYGIALSSIIFLWELGEKFRRTYQQTTSSVTAVQFLYAAKKLVYPIFYSQSSSKKHSFARAFIKERRHRRKVTFYQN